jgi:hypothetical protein
VSKFFFQDQLHQLLGRRAHVLVALAEGNDGKAHIHKVLTHLHRTPAVKGDLFDVVLRTEVFNKLFDKAVMHDISFGREKKAFFFPDVIGHMVSADPKRDIFFRYPEKGKNEIGLVFRFRRKDQDKGRQVCGA